MAKILANGKSEFIGIIIPHFEHQFYSSIVQHLIDTYTTYGYKFIIFLGKEGPDKEKKVTVNYYLIKLKVNRIKSQSPF